MDVEANGFALNNFQKLDLKYNRIADALALLRPMEPPLPKMQISQQTLLHQVTHQAGS